MSLPAYRYPPPPAPPRRRWFAGVVAGWAVLVVALGVWSVRHDPPSVPDQRNIAQALPYLERATGAMFAAADGAGRAVVLGALEVTADCDLTPVRAGVRASRDVFVHVRADQVGPAFDAIAAALPATYRARAAHGSRGDRHDLYADAGGYVAIDATAGGEDTVFTLRASTGCRPAAARTGTDQVGPPPADPAAFGRAVRAVGGTPEGATRQQVLCPDGGTGGTVVSGAVPEPADLGRALRPLVPAGGIVQADPHDWAYRDSDVSIVVAGSAGRVRVSATTGCR